MQNFSRESNTFQEVVKQFCKQMQLREHVLSANAKALKKKKKKDDKKISNYNNG